MVIELTKNKNRIISNSVICGFYMNIFSKYYDSNYFYEIQDVVDTSSKYLDSNKIQETVVSKYT